MESRKTYSFDLQRLQIRNLFFFSLDYLLSKLLRHKYAKKTISISYKKMVRNLINDHIRTELKSNMSILWKRLEYKEDIYPAVVISLVLNTLFYIRDVQYLIY